MRQIQTILTICIMVSITSCGQTQQPKVYGESPLVLENFNFNINLNEFVPKENTQQDIALYNKDTDAFFEFGENGLRLKKTVSSFWLDNVEEEKNYKFYLQWTGGDYKNVMAVFDNYKFHKLHFITTMKDEMIEICTANKNIDKEKTKEFIALLTKRYGNYEYQKSDFDGFNGYEYYTWKLDDRIIKYIVANQNGKNAEYLYIVKKEHANLMINGYGSRQSDFAYINEKS
ncbi:hypothetical protein LJB84_00290 [Bacteroidales bacterium OttesenSCG-928-J19]|nr:hypothetical protein [Bacteroidales bacterium OttesenSCG-928-J19]